MRTHTRHESVAAPDSAPAPSAKHGNALAGMDDLADLSARLEAARLELDGLYHELERLNRLAAMGTIAGMIAHEFNNILTPMLTYGQMAIASPQDPDLTRKALQKSVSGSERAAKVADAILRFIREEPATEKEVAAHGIVSQTQATCVVDGVVQEAISCLAREPSRDGVRVETDVPTGMRAAIDGVALQQVLVNLILNARQAIGNRAGMLRIAASAHQEVPLTPSGAADSRGTASSPGASSTWNSLASRPIASDDSRTAWIVITIEDSGPGIAADRMARMFQPFNTDGGSSIRRGTGLGLIVCQRLVASAGGWLTVQSGPKRGTTISIVLPVA